MPWNICKRNPALNMFQIVSGVLHSCKLSYMPGISNNIFMQTIKNIITGYDNKIRAR